MGSSLGMHIRKERRKQKLTLRDLEKLTGIDYSMISKYENGVVTPPPERIQLIASALNLTEDALLSDGQASDLDISIRRRSMFTRLEDDKLIVSDSIASKLVLQAANGQCELCGQSFPDGEAFLEPHYVIWLMDGGTPTIDNTVALCPNCHKRIHIYSDSADIEKLIKAAKNHK